MSTWPLLYATTLEIINMFGPQSQILKKLRETVPFIKRKLIVFSSNFNGRFLDWDHALTAMTCDPSVMNTMGQLLLASYSTDSSKKKAKYNIEMKVWGEHLLKEAVQIGIFVESVGVRRMKEHELFFNELSFRQSKYADNMMNVIAYFTVMKETGLQKINEMGPARYEKAGSSHSTNFRFRESISTRNTCQSRHSSTTHLKFYKSCFKPKKYDVNWTWQLCEECIQPEVLHLPHPYARGPQFSKVIKNLLPSWYEEVLQQKKEEEKKGVCAQFEEF